MPLIELQEFNPETIEKIKAFDCEAIKSFYLANYEFFLKLVNKYIRHLYVSSSLYDVNINEYMNDIYVSLPYYDFSSVQMFVVTLKYSFRYVRYGGLAYLKENNRSMLTRINLLNFVSLYYENDDGDMYLITDFLENGIDESDVIDFSLPYETVADKICEFCSKYLTDRRMEIFRYIMDGYSRDVICKKMKINSKYYDNILSQIREKLIINFKAIKEFLKENEFELLIFYDNLYLEFYNKINAKIDRRKQKQKEYYHKNSKTILEKIKNKKDKSKVAI